MTIPEQNSRRARQPPCPPVRDIDRLFFAGAGAKALCREPLRWILFAPYYRAYCRTVENDLLSFAALELGMHALQPIRRRAEAAIRTVAACSAWYAISSLILRAGFTVALSGALVTVLVAVAASSGFVFSSIAQAAAAFAFVLVFAYVSLAISGYASRWNTAGLSFDIFWFLGWSVLLWPAVEKHYITANQLVHKLSLTPLLGAAFVSALYGIAAYATLILLATILGRAIFTWTTNRKKRYPEEEIIQTLIATLSYVDRQPMAWAHQKFRKFVSRQLDWISARLELDFFRNYARADAPTQEWSAAVATRTAAAVRELKQRTLLPSLARMGEMRTALSSMLLAAARGDWASLPVSETAPASSRKSTLISALQITLSIVLPLAAAALVAWKLQDPLRTSAFTALLGLTSVNVLAALNPSGFDKQITAAKTVADALRGSGG